MNINLTVNIILFICMYPALFILYFALICTGKASGKKLFGIRYSDDWLPAGEVRALENAFSRKLRKCLFIFMAIPFAAFLTPYFSVSYAIWVTWLLAAVVVFWLQCARNYGHLLQLKEERTGQTVLPEAAYYELKGAHIRCVRWHDFIAPLLISLLAAILLFFISARKDSNPAISVLMIILAITNLSLYACALWMDRIKASVISGNSDVNVNYARATKKLWKQLWLANIWATTLFMVLILICLLSPTYTDALMSRILLWGSIAIGLIAMGSCIHLMKRKRRIEEQYSDKADNPMNAAADEEEKHWIGGIFYYNPNDRHSFVNTKFGAGITCNMARPAGKIITSFAALALLTLPVSCIWLMLEEFTPLSLAVRNNVLVARHLGEDYSISLDSIENVTLFTELPKSTKLHGTNSSTLEKGLFRNSADGKVEEFLNPQNEVFLRIDTGDAIYYMSSRSDEETLEIYHYLSELAGDGPGMP